jgi:hypothetical protein
MLVSLGTVAPLELTNSLVRIILSRNNNRKLTSRIIMIMLMMAMAMMMMMMMRMIQFFVTYMPS